MGFVAVFRMRPALVGTLLPNLPGSLELRRLEEDLAGGGRTEHERICLTASTLRKRFTSGKAGLGVGRVSGIEGSFGG